jgi:riboflavin kinase/FMN adenylyltransferase
MHKLVALRGIFAVRVTGAGLQNAAAVASVGTRPVVNGLEPLLEVSVFNFTGDLYNQQLTVHFVARLRDECWFPSLDALKEQMLIDADQARRILASR